MQLLASPEERRKLEELDALVEDWIAKLRERAESIGQDQWQAFVDRDQWEAFLGTAQRVALRLEERLPEGLDVTIVAEIRGILIGALRRIEEVGDEQPLEIIDDFLVRAESIRHIIRDALDEDVPANPGDAYGQLDVLQSWLPRLPRRELARLLDVDDRTLQRWAARETKISGRFARRIFLIAKLVALLKEAWTPEGVVAWFDRSRPELDDQSPSEVLDNPAYERVLLLAAREGRAQHGS